MVKKDKKWEWTETGKSVQEIKEAVHKGTSVSSPRSR